MAALLRELGRDVTDFWLVRPGVWIRVSTSMLFPETLVVWDPSRADRYTGLPLDHGL